jgi:sec-independent protein translocase protein TatA
LAGLFLYLYFCNEIDHIMIGGSEILVILLFILLLFGADRIPGFAKSFGKGMREFKKATDDIKRELTSETADIKEELKEIKNNVTDKMSGISSETPTDDKQRAG